MNTGTYTFTQIMSTIPRKPLARIVTAYNGEHYTKTLSCSDQFKALAFGQLAGGESLRGIALCLDTHKRKLYQLGFSTEIKRTTLADANEKRDWRIWRDVALYLITITKPLYVDEPKIADDITGACYAVDSTSIDLCLSAFHWAHYKSVQGAVKLHLGLDINGSIPSFFDMTTGKVNDVNYLDHIDFEQGAFYILDRGYLDVARLYIIHTKGAYFVTRIRHNMKFQRRYSRPVDKSTGVQCDQIVYFTGTHTKIKYPDTFRRVKYRAPDGRVYEFITNNNKVSAESIALLYKNRWKVELFFKWIKQHLKIKSFWGHTANAVKTQICIALCTYLLVAIMKKKLKLPQNLYTILQILSISLFDKSGLDELFSEGELQKDVKCPETMALPFDF